VLRWRRGLSRVATARKNGKFQGQGKVRESFKKSGEFRFLV